MSNRLAIGSTNTITLDKLKDEVTKQYVNSATVTGSLLDAAGNPVSGAQNLAMVYAAQSSGKYQGTVPSTVTLTAQDYTVRIVATDTAGVRRFDMVVTAS